MRIPFIAIFLRNTIFDGSWHKCAIVKSGVSQYSVSLSLPAAVAAMCKSYSGYLAVMGRADRADM